MFDFPLQTNSNDKHRTFVIVVAWFFTLLGASDALQNFGGATFWFLKRSYSGLANIYTLGLAAEFLFSVAAVVIGLGMLNQRATALRNAIVLLWLYLFWTMASIAWGIIEFVRQAEMMARTASTASDLGEGAFPLSGMGYLVYGSVKAVVACVICVWLARRLSRPVIKAAYAS